MKTDTGIANKPKLRGVIHLVMSPVSLVAGLVMISAAFICHLIAAIFTVFGITVNQTI